MRSFATRPALRWLVPLGVVCAIALIAAMTAVIRSGASASLPPRTAAQLLVALSDADTTGVSGTVVERADLGLPALPNNIGGDGTADWSLLLSGSHTLRVWSAGPTMSRVALLGALGESDVVRDGPDLWIWSSADNEAQHLRLPSGPATGSPERRGDALPVIAAAITRAGRDRAVGSARQDHVDPQRRRGHGRWPLRVRVGYHAA
jgi:hypothetical protein